MKKLILLLPFLCLVSCTSDNDNTPAVIPEIEGEWKLAYLLDENDLRWDPLNVCNSSYDDPQNLPLNIGYFNSDSILTAEGRTPCNSFWIEQFEFGTNSYTGLGVAITLAECMPAFMVPDCETDGNEFEQLMVMILSNYWTLHTGNPVSYEIERFGNNDTLRIVNDSLQSAVYWRPVP